MTMYAIGGKAAVMARGFVLWMTVALASVEAQDEPRPLNMPGAGQPSPGPLITRAGDTERKAAQALSDTTVVPARPKVVASFEGEPKPGETITLRAGGSMRPDLCYRWVQTLGLPVSLDTPTSPTARFLVPPGGGTVAFMLITGNKLGVDSSIVSIPIEASGLSDASIAGPRADAGDDLVGLVGHMITLNGSRSEPQGRVAYRWLLLAGPPIESHMQDGYTFSFIPTAPETYRFGLVVAADGVISEPDIVDVFVGTPASVATAARTPAAPTTLSSLKDDALARQSLASVEGGPASAEALASAFDDLALRMSLYTTYSDVFGEMSRRLGAIIPSDSARRSIWIDQLFTPLTSRLVERMRAEGLDLLRQDGQTSPMNAAQKARLVDLFGSIAQGFRATLPPR